MNPEIFQLFQKYRDLLNGQVRNEARARWISSQCTRIEDRLYRRGYQTCSRIRMEPKSCEQTGEITEITHHFELFLVMLPPHNQTPVAVAYATSTQFPPDMSHEDSFEAMLARTTKEELEAEGASAPVWRREWQFYYDDTHTFLAAFERHWELFKEEASREEIIIPDRETIFLRIEATRKIDPIPEDAAIFSFLLDKEIEYLSALVSDTELAECGCKVEEHLQALEDWEMRNLL